jgi:hypothetical protein
MPNHEDVGCSEHQIRLSKGFIAKFVQPLKLRSAIQAGAPAARAAEFAPLSLTLGFVGDLTAIFFTNEKSHRDGGFCVSVTVTVSIFSVANRVGKNGRFFAGIPDVVLPSLRSPFF